MPRKPFMFVRLLSLSLVLAASAHAAGKRHFRTLYYGKPSGAPEELVLTAGGTTVKAPLPPSNLSAPQPLPEGALTAMFSTQPLPPKTEPPANIPKAEIPEAWTNVLFLFTPDPSNPVAPVRVTPLDLGGDRFKPGQLLVMNRSQGTLSGHIGKRTLSLGPLKTAFVEAPAEGDNDYAVSIDMQLPGEKEQKPLCRSTWRQVAEDQMLVFILPDPVRKSLAIASVPIHPLPAEKPQ